MKTIKWFGAAIVGGFLGMAIFVQIAASGDLIYNDKDEVEITAQQAANLADRYIELGAWYGERTAIRSCAVVVSDTSETGYKAMCRGRKHAAPGNLPTEKGPIQVVGVVE